MLNANFVIRWLTVPYLPDPDHREFLNDVATQSQVGLEVSVAVLDGSSSRRFFGVPMARRGIQPVWIRVVNRTDQPCRLQFVSIDPAYFSPLEAAAINHFSGGRRLFGYGLLAWLFLPFLALLPMKLLSVRQANRKMDGYFHEHAFPMRPIPPQGEQSGFVFTNRTEGTKVVPVRLLCPAGLRDFEFSIPVKGLDSDYLRRELHISQEDREAKDVDQAGLRRYLVEAPPATANRAGNRRGDPVNLVVIGEFATVISAFGARWDETEVISVESCWKTARAFLTGAEYRYSPVSGLYLFGRSQDFALQRIRKSINERLHLRLWAAPIRFRNKPVWIGQVSRDIGVRLTWRTWNLTTHRIDPDVDEARDYVVEDLMHVSRLEVAGYLEGVGPCDRTSPRHNLTGDPYFTDGKRAVILVSDARTTPRLVELT
jgi:hypothetical protein